MAITVYWTCLEEEWLRAKAPESVYKNFAKNSKNQKNDIILCPATKDYIKNIFSIKSLYDYTFNINPEEDDNNAFSDFYNQKFFDDHVLVRSKKDKLFSFSQRFSFFTEENFLLMSAGIFPFLENNNITKRCTVIPGTFDIGKWFRVVEFAFYLKEEFNEFKIEENEIFQYIKFNTEEKIIFKQFKVNSKLQDFFKDTDGARKFRKSNFKPLNEYYSIMKNKKIIIKEIKNNLVD